PWEIVVNRQGRRFYREDNESVDERTERLLEQDSQQAFVIFDEAIRRKAPSIFTYFPDRTERFYEPGGCIVSANSLRELAAKCGIDGQALERSVDEYNLAVETGFDAAFGRRHMPQRIEAGPFYALPIVAYTVR